MEWADWAPTWRRIQADFGYDPAADEAAALLLHTLVPATNRFRDLGVILRNRRNVVVAGCGPSLAAAGADAYAGRVVVAADGATERLREIGVHPHVVVTDLDGNPDALAWAAGVGAAMVVHAHGDNQDAIRGWVPRLGPQVYGTHQVEPRPALEPMRNVGGFTDGDRAVMLCEALGARAVRLVGFDFHAGPSRYSHRWDPATKPRKLAWAEGIVAGVQERGRMRLERWVA